MEQNHETHPFFRKFANHKSIKQQIQ